MNIRIYVSLIKTYYRFLIPYYTYIRYNITKSYFTRGKNLSSHNRIVPIFTRAKEAKAPISERNRNPLLLQLRGLQEGEVTAYMHTYSTLRTCEYHVSTSQFVTLQKSLEYNEIDEVNTNS